MWSLFKKKKQPKTHKISVLKHKRHGWTRHRMLRAQIDKTNAKLIMLRCGNSI